MTGDVPSAQLAQDEQDPTAAASGAELDDAPLPAPTPQQGRFGFTLRELIIVGAWVLAFGLSFAPGAGSVLDSTATVWAMNGAWLLAIGVPTAAVFLLVLRRLSPEGIRRVGSLGIDQFASVAFSVSLVSWAVLLWQQLDLVGATRRSALITWPLWLEILLLLVLVVVTVCAALIPGIREDFEGRMETLAHRNANPVRPVSTRPRPLRARGSISDPHNEDDVDPGLRHENEVGAAGHAAAVRVTGAAVQGEADYVPEQHRTSFLASSESPEEASGRGVEAPAAGEAASGGIEPVADAPTEAILDVVPARVPSAVTERPGGLELEDDLPDERGTTAETRRGAAASGSVPTARAVTAEPAGDEVPAEPAVAETRGEETATRGGGDKPTAEPATSEPATGESATGESATDEPLDTGSVPTHSDTMTEVLGDLLVPSAVDEVATHAVDIVSDDAEERSDTGSAAGATQPQPFWALAPEKRVVHDARGDAIFTIGPDAWILVLEDRGGAFVVRHDDGRVGYLHDTENMTRG